MSPSAQARTRKEEWMFTSAEEVLQFIQDEDVQFVDVRFCDLPGVMQHFNVPAKGLDLDFFTEGQMFDGSSIRGFQAINESDMKLIPDVTSAFVDPFRAQKTMYAGKQIAMGDTIYIFASENEGGQGLIARGIVTHAAAVPKKRGIARQTPRVSVTIKRTALAKRPMGRRELKHLTDWNDGQPGTELNFKFYRQATDKIVGISEETARFLLGFF